MHIMSDIQNKTRRSANTAARIADKTAFTSPGSAEKFAGASKNAKTGSTPKMRQQAGSTKIALFSPSSKQIGSISPASPRTRQAEPLSPYKPLSTRPEAPPSPRAYLEGLKPDNLARSIFRDQTVANTAAFPTAWVAEIQESVRAPVEKLRQAMYAHLAPMSKEAVDALYPGAGEDGRHDWKPFGDLCGALWQALSANVLSLKKLPTRTVGLLAEFHAELARLPAFRELEQPARDKIVADALFNLLIWNGIVNALTRSVDASHQRIAHGFGAYLKAAWGMQAQSQGGISTGVASLVQERHLARCTRFQAALTREVDRVAALRTATLQDDQHDHALNSLRETNIDIHLTATWPHRNDDYAEIVKQGNYFVVDGDGVQTRCASYDAFKAFVGAGAKGTLPEVVLHVAGVRIANFLCETYLYGRRKPIFIDAQGRRVDPVPSLRAEFVLRRDEDNDGKITVGFSCTDPAVGTVMLVEPGRDELQFEAHPLFPASLEFHGEMHFYENEEFEAGAIRVAGQNFHLCKTP